MEEHPYGYLVNFSQGFTELVFYNSLFPRQALTKGNRQLNKLHRLP
jgi:hypothetical protein